MPHKYSFLVVCVSRAEFDGYCEGELIKVCSFLVLFWCHLTEEITSDRMDVLIRLFQKLRCNLGTNLRKMTKMVPLCLSLGSI